MKPKPTPTLTTNNLAPERQPAAEPAAEPAEVTGGSTPIEQAAEPAEATPDVPTIGLAMIGLTRVKASLWSISSRCQKDSGTEASLHRWVRLMTPQVLSKPDVEAYLPSIPGAKANDPGRCVESTIPRLLQFHIGQAARSLIRLIRDEPRPGDRDLIDVSHLDRLGRGYPRLERVGSAREGFRLEPIDPDEKPRHERATTLR